MSTRKIIDLKQNGEKVWLKGHAQAIYMSDGSTVEDAINSIDIPSLDDYVTETELNDKGFLTEHQDISHLASRNWVETQGYAHQEDLLEISFNDIQDSPISIDDSGMINFVDESGNVGFQINEEGLRVTDVIAGDHKLSEKANASDIPSLDGYAKTEDIPSVDGLVKTEDLPNFDEFAKTEDIPSLDGYATEEWVNNKNYATEYDLKNIDYSSINNVPVSEDKTGELNITDESGNIGMKVASEAVYAKDFVAGEHKLSEKVDKTYVDNSIAELVDGAPETLDTLNELAAALHDNADIVDVLNQSIGNKQDAITDLETIRQGAAKGATALQSYTEQYKGTVTGVKINGTTKNPSGGVVDLGTVITSHQTLKTVNGQSLIGSGDITISGGSSNSNVQAVDTGDVIDDVTVNYATKTYVDGLVGDINSVLESIINGGSSNIELIDNNMYYRSNLIDDTSQYYFSLEYPAESDLTITATYSKPNVVNGVLQGHIDVTDEYHINKGNYVINETISEFREFTNVTITPESDNKYRYIYNG